jgi:hypothetical protein
MKNAPRVIKGDGSELAGDELNIEGSTTAG